MGIKGLASAGVLALLLAAPGAASGAQIATDRGCYLDKRNVTLSGTGFTPGAPYQVTLDGQPITGGTGRVDPAGGVTGTFVPRLSDQGARIRQHRYTLAVQEGSNTAATQFTVTKFLADFNPASGDPKRLRVRFSVYGFGLSAPNPEVYLHYVRPDGKLRRTIRLGRAKGSCGAIKRTARKRLFPFDAARGTWRLQFDTNREYRVGKPSSDFLFYTVGVRIRRLSGSASSASAPAASAGAFVSTSSPSAASTRTVSPSRNSPSRIASASLSTSRFWMTRLSGRAPYVGS
jgi:hypothetical protein